MSSEVENPPSSNLKVSGAEHIIEEPDLSPGNGPLPQAGTETAHDGEPSDEPLFYSCPSTQEHSEVHPVIKPSSYYAKETLHNDRPDFDLELNEFLDMSAFEDPMASSSVKHDTEKAIRRYSPPLAKLKNYDEDSFVKPHLGRETSIKPPLPITRAFPANTSLFSEFSTLDTLASSNVATSNPPLFRPKISSDNAPVKALETARTAIIHEVPAQDLDLDDLEDWLMGGNVEIVD